jgi:hypothetical protein
LIGAISRAPRQSEHAPIDTVGDGLHNAFMLDINALSAQDLRGLSPDAMAQVAQQMFTRIAQQDKPIDEQAKTVKFKDVKIERITFELARLKAWRFGAKTTAALCPRRKVCRAARWTYPQPLWISM